MAVDRKSLSIKFRRRMTGLGCVHTRETAFRLQRLIAGMSTESTVDLNVADTNSLRAWLGTARRMDLARRLD